MTILMMCIIYLVILTSIMIPRLNHANKIDYLLEQGYVKMEHVAGYYDGVEVTYVRGNKSISESELRKLSLHELKEKY